MEKQEKDSIKYPENVELAKGIKGVFTYRIRLDLRNSDEDESILKRLKKISDKLNNEYPDK